MTTGQHGGYRKPQRPAAVSPPQSGARTDGGAADKQPIRTPTGGGYGEAKALTEQQQGAPMAAGGSTPSAAPSPEGGQPPGAASPGLFGPSNRPSESITAGISGAPGQPMLTSDELLRVLYSKRPSPYLARLLRDR